MTNENKLTMPSRILEEAQTRFEALNRELETLPYLEVRRWLKTLPNRYSRFLYKFRSVQSDQDIARLREIVVRSQLWLSSPKNFNDPFDLGIEYTFKSTIKEKKEHIKQLLREKGKTFREIEKLMPGLVKRVGALDLPAQMQELMYNTGVCSFAGDPRNIQMWSHYASDHKGLCLVFEIAKDPKTFLTALPVEYSLEYPVINWIKDKRGRAEVFLRKHHGWSYEKEWRIVELDRPNTRLGFRPGALRAIITGCSAGGTTLEKLNILLDERAKENLPPIVIYQCKRHESRYQLRIFKA